MSLLMDALKRAEKARQAEAAKEAGGDDLSDSREMSLDPLEDQSPSDEAPAPEPSSPAPSPDDSSELQFSLDDEDSTSAKSRPSHSTDTTKHLGPFSLMDDDSISREDTGEMRPVAREAEEAVQDYFDETNSMAIELEDIQQVLNEDTVAGTQQVTAEEVARQAAHTVFDAKIPSARRRGWAAVVIVPLVLVLFFGVSGFFLWDDLVRTFVGPPPIVARQPPPVAGVGTSPVSEATQVETASSPAVESETQMTAKSTVAESGSGPVTPLAAEPGLSSKLVEAAVAESGTAVAESMAKSAPAPADAGAESVSVAEPEPMTSKSGAAVTIAALTAEALTGSANAGHLAIAPRLKISRKSTPDQVHPTLQKAYEALRRGENARARDFYEQVLTVEPRNRNALLGVGAIATRAGDIEGARQTYARLLALYPKDPIARAALIDSHQDVSAVEGEGHIRRLLSVDPSQPYLYATLGNLYARQARWPEAQQAYFDAYRLNNANADYAFNLAVSLDRIGQPVAALSYYRRALELAEGGQASFETQAVLKRISSLGSAASG